MIISLKGHQALRLISGRISVLATNNPIAFTEVLNALQGYSDELTLVDNSYNTMEINKFIDFDTDVLITHRLFEKYSKNIASTLLNNMNVDEHNRIDKEAQQLFTVLQESLFMTDLPIELHYDGDAKRLLNYAKMHFLLENQHDPYDIIINDLKVHLECNLKGVLCFSNLANYLSKKQFVDLLSDIQSMQIPLLLVEFTEMSNRDFYGDTEFLFIDQDFVDWKL